MKVNKDLIQFYTDDLANTLIQKNHDYGNSVQEQFDEYGLTSLLIRLDDKLRRLKTLRTHDPKVVGESIQDTLKDIAGYALLGQICVAHEEKEEMATFGQLQVPKSMVATCDNCNRKLGLIGCSNKSGGKFCSVICADTYEAIRMEIKIPKKPPYADLDDE